MLALARANRGRLARPQRVRRPRSAGGWQRAPGPVDDHPHAHAGRFAVGHVADLMLAGDDRLVEVAADAHIAVAGLGRACGGQRHVRQAPALEGVDRGEQLLGGDGTGMRQQQARQAQTGKSQELTSLHSVSLSRLRAAGNGPSRSRQPLDFRQRGASGQVTACHGWGCYGRACSPAPAQSRSNSHSNSGLAGEWRGGVGGQDTPLTPLRVRPSRWRLGVRALAKQCFASKAPSPMGARWRHPWRQRSCPPTPPRLRQIPAAVGRCRPWSTHLSDIEMKFGVRSVFLRKTDLTPRVFPTDRGQLSKAGRVRWQGRERHGWRDRASMDGFTASPATGSPPPSLRKPLLLLLWLWLLPLLWLEAGAGRSPAQNTPSCTMGPTPPGHPPDVEQAVFRSLRAQPRTDRRRTRPVDGRPPSGAGNRQRHRPARAFFAERWPWMRWQPSDHPDHLPGIEAWRAEAALLNLLPPVALQVELPPAPGLSLPQSSTFDAAFSANTLHIMSWAHVQALFAALPSVLRRGALLAAYGPFQLRRPQQQRQQRAVRCLAEGARTRAAASAIAKRCRRWPPTTDSPAWGIWRCRPTTACCCGGWGKPSVVPAAGRQPIAGMNAGQRPALPSGHLHDMQRLRIAPLRQQGRFARLGLLEMRSLTWPKPRMCSGMLAISTARARRSSIQAVQQTCTVAS